MRKSLFAAGFGGVFLIAAAFLGGGCSSFPQEELYPVDITINEIETKMGKALDPSGRYAKAKSYVQQQVSENIRWLDDDDGGVLTSVKFLSPDKLLMVNYVDNSPGSGIIINGSRGWVVDYPKRDVRELDENRMRLVRTLTLIANPGSRLSQVFEDIKIQGSRIEGKEYYKLTCVIDEDNPGIPPLDIYIDQEDFLIRIYRVGKTVSRVIRYGMHEGVMIPVTIETNSDGRRTRVSVVDYKLDVEIPVEEFYPPVFTR